MSEGNSRGPLGLALRGGLELLIPKYFFVTSGKGISRVSDLNAYDKALQRAGIAQSNLVYVSSIIPPGAVEVKPIPLPPGSIAFAVVAEARGKDGERIGAGIAWGLPSDGGYGYVVEAHGSKNYTELLRELRGKIYEMARSRGVKLAFFRTRIETLRIPRGCYGATVAAVVFVPEVLMGTK